MVPPQADRAGLLLAICERLVGEGSQVLVFRATIKDTVETARQLRQRFRAHGLPRHITERINELDDSDASLTLDWTWPPVSPSTTAI